MLPENSDLFYFNYEVHLIFSKLFNISYFNKLKKNVTDILQNTDCAVAQLMSFIGFSHDCNQILELLDHSSLYYSVRKVAIFFLNLVEVNETCLHEATLNLHTHT